MKSVNPLWRINPIIIGLFFLAAVITVMTLLVGSYPITAGQLLPAALGQLGEISQLVVIDYRLPRILTALLVGASLGMAGAIFQTLMRNPLASPDVMGFSSGAAAGALACVILISGNYLVAGAVIGGLVSALLVLLLSWRNGINTYRLILIGIGFNFVLTAILDLMLSRIDINQAVEMNKWLAGTLNASTWRQVQQLCIGLLVLLPLAFWLQFSLNRLTLHDDLATGLGVAVNKVRLFVITVGVFLTALAVSVAGPLPFVAFVSGPIARSLLKSADASLFTAALIGAVVTLLADTAARYMGNWVNMPTGVFTALIGAPYLLWLLLTQIRRGQI